MTDLYQFVYRALLTEEALDRAGRRRRASSDVSREQMEAALNYELLETDDLNSALAMATVYAAITAFERSARRFVAKILQGDHGDQWWDTCVSEKIRRFAEGRREDESKTKWHGTRGDDLLTYTELGHLVNIVQQNWDAFEAHVRRIDWVTSVFGTIERSRNVIMHSGTLDQEDIERVGMNIRDWVKQVGA